MIISFLFVSLAYAAFALTVRSFEARRVRGSGIDAITVFVVIFLIQCCIPGIVLFAALPFVDAGAPTGTAFFDKIFQATDVTAALLVFGLTAWFIIFFYVGTEFGERLFKRRESSRPAKGLLKVSVNKRRLTAVIVLGLALTLWFFYDLGESITSRYAALILFRAGFEGIERNALNSNAFALTQTWSWLSVLAVICVLERRGRRGLLVASVAVATVFALLGASRRALFLPLLLGYLTVALYRGRARLRWVVIACIPLVLWLAVGKDLLATLAYGGSLETVVTGSGRSWVSLLLGAFSDLGITIVESLGTILLVHVDLRFGVDHILSLLQRFPEGVLGLDFNFPERIVRVTTETFADSYAQDIPPGFAGQMWLDFGIAGPLVWGLIFGLQMSVVQHAFRKSERSLESSALLVLLTFLISLPINTGSFDFTFSIDIIVLLVALAWCVSIHRRPHAEPMTAIPAFDAT